MQSSPTTVQAYIKYLSVQASLSNIPKYLLNLAAALPQGVTKTKVGLIETAIKILAANKKNWK